VRLRSAMMLASWNSPSSHAAEARFQRLLQRSKYGVAPLQPMKSTFNSSVDIRGSPWHPPYGTQSKSSQPSYRSAYRRWTSRLSAAQ